MVSTDVIVTAGLARSAGAIAMGLGGYLAARTDAEHYTSEESRENYEIEHMREKETEEVDDIKGHFTGVKKIKAAAQTLLVGGSQRVRLIGSPICLGRSVADVHGLIAIKPSCSSRA